MSEPVLPSVGELLRLRDAVNKVRILRDMWLAQSEDPHTSSDVRMLRDMADALADAVGGVDEFTFEQQAADRFERTMRRQAGALSGRHCRACHVRLPHNDAERRTCNDIIRRTT